jgi:glyoxylase-like metal-dependent hydrolase (beta-lactamase superfamily II)
VQTQHWITNGDLRQTRVVTSAQLERFDDVYRLRLQSVAGRAIGLDVSAYVIRGIMIDTGFHHARQHVMRAVESLNVRGVLVTHWHEDHAGNVATLAKRGVPALVRPDTEAILRERPPIQLYRRVFWGHPPPLATPLTTLDPSGLECVHTPGHSTDHQIIWDPQTRTLFSGDLWLGVRARVLHSTEDPYVLLDSLRRASALEPHRMFDAHRGLVEHPIRAIDAKVHWLEKTLHEIARRVDEGWSDRAIVQRVLGGEEIAAVVSRGDYSRRNLVRAVRRHAAIAPGSSVHG